MPCSTVENILVSDHRPILLSWPEKQCRKGFSFKFDRTLLQDTAFNEYIINAWKELKARDKLPHFKTFREKMEEIREIVKKWKIQKRQKDKRELQMLQQELDSLLGLTDYASCSFEMKCRLRELEKKKFKLMQQEESLWRLKSRALWIQEGDKNTKFFHNYASARRAKNSIWKIKDDKGGYAVSHDDITKQAVSFFKDHYRKGKYIAFRDILWGIDLVPEMFDDEKNEALFQPITENELLGVMKSFNKDKSPGPDGWTIEFLIHFYDLFKLDLLRMVEASRMSGIIHHHATSALIALIPKKGEPDSFQDFTLISLCNISFKIITKIIAERIKDTLASCLTPNQHAFLKGRNILDDVASTQECLHSMFSHNSEAAIMKIDLQKAYDCLDCGFMQSLLAKIGLKPNPIRWIMACIENVNYAVIINGFPSPFFRAERGLRQGCPLSPLLFILAMNSMSTHINKPVDEKMYDLIKICKHIFISHNLFVDDVLLFAMLSRAS